MDLICPLGKSCTWVGPMDGADESPHKQCHWWVVLKDETGRNIGQCAMAWIPTLLIELRGMIKRKIPPTANVE